MSVPSGFMYASPEQVMKDRADYARRNIARGKPVLGMEYADGVLLLAENPSATLHKVSEIYDRIAFAGVGKYPEYENLRIHGIRQADLKGYAYSRDDVTPRSLANLYSQILDQIFTNSMKPYEAEILVAGVGDERNEMYHVTFDGVMIDEHGFAAVGGQADALKTHLAEHYEATPDLNAAVKLGVEALATVGNTELGADQLEAAVLDRNLPRRKFRRLEAAELASALS
ncbi:MAG: proteasome subunit alpha [Actinomycetota bacterium]